MVKEKGGQSHGKTILSRTEEEYLATLSHRKDKIDKKFIYAEIISIIDIFF
jgi:hypothetical protein